MFVRHAIKFEISLFRGKKIHYCTYQQTMEYQCNKLTIIKHYYVSTSVLGVKLVQFTLFKRQLLLDAARIITNVLDCNFVLLNAFITRELI